MMAANIALPSVAAKQSSRGKRAAGLFFVMLVYSWNLLFLYFLLPRILILFDTEKIGQARYYNRFFSTRLFLGLGHLVHDYAYIGFPMLLGLAVWNGWAICSPDLKRYKKARLVMILVGLFSVAWFILAVISAISLLAM